MRPSEIFNQYQDNKIDRSTAISALKSFLENSSDDKIRINSSFSCTNLFSLVNIGGSSILMFFSKLMLYTPQ